MNRIRPYTVVSDGEGNLFEDKTLFAVARHGFETVPLYLDEMIPLPEGSDCFELPRRNALGHNANGELVVSKEGIATAAFSAPAYTLLHQAQWKNNPNAPTLPLFAYGPLAWYKGQFYTSAVRIDPDRRQDTSQFNQNIVEHQAKRLLKKFKNNRLVQHVLNNCALTYMCPAARNFAIGRWEAPLPTSPACNARCIGCISFQSEKESPISCTQPRLRFKPTPQEIAEMAVFHIENSPLPIVSFGQGCEGEPLLAWQNINEAIKLIRQQTKKGIINLNTNASKPQAVEELCKSGLDSIRVSMNSAQKELYTAYYRPTDYSFETVQETMAVARKYNKWISINYFVFPGITDQTSEIEALERLIDTHKINLIQWRNFNIDPDWFFETTGISSLEPSLGILNIQERLRKKYPHLAFGYFNPSRETMQSYGFNFE